MAKYPTNAAFPSPRAIVVGGSMGGLFAALLLRRAGWRIDVFERIGGELAGRLKVVRLDVDQAAEIAARYGAQSIPLLVLFRDGEEIDRLVGAVPERQLRKWLEPHLTPAPSAQTS